MESNSCGVYRDPANAYQIIHQCIISANALHVCIILYFQTKYKLPEKQMNQSYARVNALYATLTRE